LDPVFPFISKIARGEDGGTESLKFKPTNEE
jgi:hypothetical protein